MASKASHSYHAHTNDFAGDSVLNAADEEECCPICIETLDEQDKRFFACPCNYKVCVFCVRRMMTEFDGRCPGCRRDYKEDNFRFTTSTPVSNEDDLTNHKNGRRRKKASNSASSGVFEKGRKTYDYHKDAVADDGSRHVSSHPQTQHNNSSGVNHKHRSNADLSNVRVVQDNLVYLIGLPPSLAREDTLRQQRFFGQYGKIIKIVLSRNSDKGANLEYGGKLPKEGWPRTPSSSAYITYSRAEDAKMCLQAVNGVWIDNHMIRASYGTTKYCNMFLRGLQCTNPECLYLHKLGNAAASFTKEEMQQSGRSHFQDVSHVTLEAPGLDGRDEKTCLPPRGSRPPSTLDNSTHNKPGKKQVGTHKGDKVGAPVKNAWGSKSDSVSRVMSSRSQAKSSAAVPAPPGISSAPPPGITSPVQAPIKPAGEWASTVTNSPESGKAKTTKESDSNPKLLTAQEPRNGIGLSFLDSFPGLASSIGPPLASHDDIVKTLNEVKETNTKQETATKLTDSSEAQALLSSLGGVKLSEYKDKPRPPLSPGPIGSRKSYVSPIGVHNLLEPRNVMDNQHSIPSMHQVGQDKQQSFQHYKSTNLNRSKPTRQTMYSESSHGEAASRGDKNFRPGSPASNPVNGTTSAPTNGMMNKTRGGKDEEWLRSLLPNANVNFADANHVRGNVMRSTGVNKASGLGVSEGPTLGRPNMLGNSGNRVLHAPGFSGNHNPNQAAMPVKKMIRQTGPHVQANAGGAVWGVPSKSINLLDAQPQFTPDFQQQPKFQILSNVHRGKSNTRMQPLKSLDYGKQDKSMSKK